MSQIINTNMSSMFAQRSLNSTQASQQTAMERLSSGKRINSAADDAAGLAIAETMTAQIKGANQAIKNVNDGISYVQTADGALGEVQSLLQRARELKVQSLNGTNTADQIDYIDTEFTALVAEIENILQDTKYNDETILNNSGAKTILSGWEDDVTVSLHATGTQGSQTAGTALSGAKTVTAGSNDEIKITVDGGSQVTATIGAATYANTDTGRAELAAAIESAFNTALSDDNQSVTVSVSVDANDKLVVTSDAIGSGSSIALAAGDDDALAGLFGTPATAVAGVAAADSTSTDLDNFAQIHAVLYGHTASTKLTTLDNTTLAEFDDAIDVINTVRAGYGSLQNRFEHISNNLQSFSENITASKSQIMDADFAAESAELARTNVLQQAGMAMLAQANQAPNNILALIK